MLRKGRAEWKTYKNVFDKFTDDTLVKLQNQGHFDELISPVMIGKEANVFTASKDGKLVIIKIYRMMNANFNKMYEYISQDPRFAGIRKRKRDTILAWVQREYRNLMLAREHCRVPTPYIQKNNVIVMEMIGKKEPAPQLKNTEADEEVLKKLVLEVRNLWHKAKLVHGDLSSFNVLNDSGKPIMIDFSQSSPTSAYNAKELLERDLGNIAKFFKVDKEALVREVLKE
jgi:RIO kinase 1